MLQLPVLGIFFYACRCWYVCTQELYKHYKRICSESWRWEKKSLATLGSWACVRIAPYFSVWCSTLWATSCPLRYSRTPFGQSLKSRWVEYNVWYSLLKATAEILVKKWNNIQQRTFEFKTNRPGTFFYFCFTLTSSKKKKKKKAICLWFLDKTNFYKSCSFKRVLQYNMSWNEISYVADTMWCILSYIPLSLSYNPWKIKFLSLSSVCVSLSVSHPMALSLCI